MEGCSEQKIHTRMHMMEYMFIAYGKKFHNWRASVASETLTGVTQLKIGDVCLFIYLYICLDVCMSFWDGVERGANTKIRRVSVRSAFDPVPNFTKQNPPV